MKTITWNEFKSSLIFRNLDIRIPSLGITVDKKQFVGAKGYNVEAQDKFLKKIYDSILL